MTDAAFTSRTAAIFGCGGPALTGDERAFFAETRPLGFILFDHNAETPDQVRALVAELRSCVDDAEAPVLVDQEGGRVQQLGPPHWQARPPMRTFGRLHESDGPAAIEALRRNVEGLASELAGLGVDVDCAPVLDVRDPGGHDVIGDRAFGDDPETVTALGRVAIDAFLAAGVLPVAKHIPGHGRATADSHLELPRVDAPLDALARHDFAPFKALADCPLAMTAHIVFEAIDPENPATQSSRLIDEIVRGEIGFDGLLISDDLTMEALEGGLTERAHRSRLAGCDVVLHCAADLDGMQAVAHGAGPMDAESARRWTAARGRKATPS